MSGGNLASVNPAGGNNPGNGNYAAGSIPGNECGAAEDGVSVLARTTARPSLELLCPTLFAPTTLSAADVVQVCDSPTHPLPTGRQDTTHHIVSALTINPNNNNSNDTTQVSVNTVIESVSFNETF